MFGIFYLANGTRYIDSDLDSEQPFYQRFQITFQITFLHPVFLTLSTSRIFELNEGAKKGAKKKGCLFVWGGNKSSK